MIDWFVKPFLRLLTIFRDVDQVHDMMEDIAEQQDVAKEISDAISNPVAFGKKFCLMRSRERFCDFRFV